MKGMRFEAKDKKGTVLIYDSIGPYYEGVSAKGFAHELGNLGELDQLDVHINSPGGSVFDGLAIYNTLRQHPAQINTIIDGAALSIASVIAQAGKTVTMKRGSMMMIHDPWTVVLGNAQDLIKEAAALDKAKVGMLAAYGEHSALSLDQLSQAMGDETWYTADEAVTAGLATAAEDTSAVALWFDPEAMGFHNIPKDSAPAIDDEPWRVRLMRRRLDLLSLT